MSVSSSVLAASVVRDLDDDVVLKFVSWAALLRVLGLPLQAEHLDCWKVGDVQSCSSGCGHLSAPPS